MVAPRISRFCLFRCIKRQTEELPTKYEYDYVVSFWMNQACGSKKNVKGNDVRDFFELSKSKTVKKVMIFLIFQCFLIKKNEKGNGFLDLFDVFG